MSKRQLVAPMFVAALLLGGRALASEPRSCGSTCCEGQAAPAKAPHGEFTIAIDLAGQVVVQVKPKAEEDLPCQGYQFCLPLDQICPLLGQLVGVPAGLYAEYFLDQGQGGCCQGCGPAHGGVSVEEQATPIEDQVNSLLRASHKALRTGDFDQAQHLAQRALDLNPQAVAAHPLVSKRDLLGKIQAHCLRSFICGPAARPATEEAESRPEEDQPSRPSPAVDPNLVNALEQTLNNTADPLPARMVVLPGEQGPGQAGEDMSAAWPVIPAQVDAPSLLDEPVDEDATPEAEEDTPEPAQDMNAVLREVIQAVRGGVCMEIDNSTEDGLLSQCEIQVGGVEVKLIWSETGCCHCAVVRLLPEACNDLGAVQRALDQQVIEWIESMNAIQETKPTRVQGEPSSTGLEPEPDSDL
jgi:hypothetical protein